MLPQSTVDWFRREREAGREPKSLSPLGAYDAAPRKGARDQEGELPSHIARQIDAIGDSSAKQLLSHLKRRFARDEEEADDRQAGDADVGNPGLGAAILDFLRDAGVDPKVCERVEQILETGGGDGTLRISHGEEGPGAMVGADAPPPFRGACALHVR
jgi:hypothetical protein